MTVGQFAASFGSTKLILFLKHLHYLPDSNYLFNASYFGNFEAVKYFYNQDGGYWGYSATINGRTPIHMASENGHLKIVKFFVQNGHDSSPECAKRMTPIHLAAYYNRLEVLKYLVPLVKNPFSKTIRGLNALDIAEQKGNIEVINYLRSVYGDKKKIKQQENNSDENLMFLLIYFTCFFITFVSIYLHYSYED